MTPWRLAPLLLSLLTAASAAQAQSPSTVALSLAHSDNGGGRIHLQMRFGSALGPMRLDTGASSSRIALAPWNQDLPSLGQSLSTGAGGAALLCEDVEARNVALQAVSGNAIARVKYVVARCPTGAGDDLLGLDFFRGARFTLDLARKEMLFFGPVGSGAARRFRLLGPEQRLVGIDLRAGDAATVGLFDTGAEVSAVDAQFVAQHRALFAPLKTKSKARDAGGRPMAAKLYRLKQIDIGDGRVIRGLPVLVYDFGGLRAALGGQAPIILGYNYISRFLWDLDFTNAAAPTWRARIYPAGDVTPPPPGAPMQSLPAR